MALFVVITGSESVSLETTMRGTTMKKFVFTMRLRLFSRQAHTLNITPPAAAVAAVVVWAAVAV
jgi:hypothetical protein